MSDVNRMSTFQLILLFVCVLLVSCADDRKVTTQFLHHEVQLADNMTEEIGITHIQAKGKVDALHYLISTLGTLTVLVVRTNANATLNINWEALTGNNTEMAKSISFDKHVYNQYSVLFNRLIVYNDEHDKADMNEYGVNDTTWRSYDFTDFSWRNISMESDAKSNIVVLKASYDNLPELWVQNGTLEIKIQAFGTSGRETELPHLEYNSDIVMFDLNIDHVTIADMPKARFAVEMMVVGEDKHAMKVANSKSIDDEYTPGVFEIYNWQTKVGSSDGGYLQWKAVCYKSMTRARGVATGIKSYGITELDDHKQALLNKTVVYGFYGDSIMSVMTRANNISFGLSEDGTYNKTAVTTWSASIGYGTPPTDSVSTIVIIIITSGLGLPGLIIILGGIYVCIKKKSTGDRELTVNVNGYQPIQDTD